MNITPQELAEVQETAEKQYLNHLAIYPNDSKLDENLKTERKAFVRQLCVSHYDVRVRLAETLVDPTMRSEKVATLLNENNAAQDENMTIKEAVASGSSYFIQSKYLDPTVLSIDCDEDNGVEIAEDILRTLHKFRPVMLLSGRKNHTHVFCRFPDVETTEQYSNLVKIFHESVSFRTNSGGIRPPGTPHRSGLRISFPFQDTEDLYSTLKAIAPTNGAGVIRKFNKNRAVRSRVSLQEKSESLRTAYFKDNSTVFPRSVQQLLSNRTQDASSVAALTAKIWMQRRGSNGFDAWVKELRRPQYYLGTLSVKTNYPISERRLKTIWEAEKTKTNTSSQAPIYQDLAEKEEIKERKSDHIPYLAKWSAAFRAADNNGELLNIEGFAPGVLRMAFVGVIRHAHERGLNFGLNMAVRDLALQSGSLRRNAASKAISWMIQNGWLRLDAQHGYVRSAAYSLIIPSQWRDMPSSNTLTVLEPDADVWRTRSIGPVGYHLLDILTQNGGKLVLADLPATLGISERHFKKLLRVLNGAGLVSIRKSNVMLRRANIRLPLEKLAVGLSVVQAQREYNKAIHHERMAYHVKWLQRKAEGDPLSTFVYNDDRWNNMQTSMYIRKQNTKDRAGKFASLTSGRKNLSETLSSLLKDFKATQREKARISSKKPPRLTETPPKNRYKPIYGLFSNIRRNQIYNTSLYW